MILQLSAAVAALAFVVLVTAVVISLRKLNRTLDSVDLTLNEVRPKLEELTDQSKRTLEEARILMEDVHKKTRQADSFFETLRNMGNGLQELSSSITRNASAQKERLGNVTALLGSGLDLFKKWRSDKSSNKGKVKRVK
ncbi:uncharacterized protein YoxC [Melghirimyces profundicolus]|uniref:Uncharacterized protein YoxC n=1 Tax=Melghirimyces profundicolus TaxID=1242148 RepID=A0A2T6BGK4_9BACL|nr:DUF948 domain-containing protein [Melghirimyces profundicolus]PTX55189.1 uncharacterized protein YoxC [Melghirimyces profundicolus]